MRLTAQALNRATLARQLLLQREPLDVADGVRRCVALQAQEPASPYLALWSRLAGFDPTELDRAFDEASMVKAQLFRITLHVIDRADYPAFHAAMTPSLRAARLNDARFRRSGLTPADADALLPEVLDFVAVPRSNAEAEAWLDERLGVTPKPGVWWAFRQYAPIRHHPTGGPWSFGRRPMYVAAPSPDDPVDTAMGTQWIVRRYLEGFGPATIQDIAQFSTIYRPPIRDAVAALGEALVRHEGPDGVELIDIGEGLIPAEDSPAPPRLLPMWDSVLLAYADRSRLIPPEYRKLVIRSNGDVLPTLLVDGLVAGVWRPTDHAIEATAFHPLSDAAWAGLEAEAAALRSLLADRDPMTYRRHTRWWSQLPAGEVRLLAT